jgi:hypothetical protein
VTTHIASPSDSCWTGSVAEVSDGVEHLGPYRILQARQAKELEFLAPPRRGIVMEPYLPR